MPWLERAITLLQGGGCDPVVVVLGADADAAAHLVPNDPRVVSVVSDNWSQGMGASLRDGMAAVEQHAPTAPAVVITLVDLPDLARDVVLRVAEDATASSLRQATFDSRPGHPVVVGRDHWSGFAAALSGDTGGKVYLRTAGATTVECGDLGDGRDIDTVEQLRRSQ